MKDKSSIVQEVANLLKTIRKLVLSYRKSGTLDDAEKISKIQKETKFMEKWTDNFVPYAT